MAKEFTDLEICLKCVDVSEILYDHDGKYLNRITSIRLECPDIHYGSILRNLPECTAIFLMSIKQRIIMNESGVRFDTRNDIMGMQAKIADMQVPQKCKTYIGDISTQAYQMLKSHNFLEYLVEFDAKRSANVWLFGKKALVLGSFDILSLLDDRPFVTLTPKQSKTKQKCKINRDVKNKKTNENTSNNDDIMDNISLMETVSEQTISSKSLGKAVLTVIVTARNHISALDIFRQYLFMYVQNLSRFFFLVVHIGPLVEKEEMVLFEYKPPRSLIKLVKTFRNAREKKLTKETGEHQMELAKLENYHSNHVENGPIEFVVSQTVQKSNVLGPQLTLEEVTETNDLDLSQLEAEFRTVKGHYLQNVAPLRDYFRYMVYDCPGVIDHQKASRDRYERYMAKQERKREEKLKRAKETAQDNDHENEPVFTFESNKSVFGSTSKLTSVNSPRMVYETEANES